MPMNPATVPVAIVAAILFGAGWALQHAAVRGEERSEVMDPRLLIRLCRRPLWLLGRLAATVGVGVQFLALRLGPLSVVAPLMVAGLVIAVPMEAALAGRRPDGGELRAVGITGIGIAMFLAAAAPTPHAGEPSGAAWAVAVGAVAGVVALCAILRALSPRWSAAALGVATGTMFGLAAALLKGAAVRAHSPASLAADPRVYAYLIVSVFALTLTQNAFQEGRLATPLVAINLSEPVTALVIGLTAFNEEIQAGTTRLVIGVLAAVVVATGIRRLSIIMAAQEADTVSAE